MKQKSSSSSNQWSPQTQTMLLTKSMWWGLMDKDAIDEYGRTALMESVRFDAKTNKKASPLLVQKLLDEGADLNTKNREGRTVCRFKTLFTNGRLIPVRVLD